MTPKKRAKSALTADFVTGLATAPAAEPAAPPAAARAEPAEPATKSAAKAPKKAVTQRSAPAAGHAEFNSWWKPETLRAAQSAFQADSDNGQLEAPESFAAWLSQAIEDLARLEPAQRIEAVKTAEPMPARGRGKARSFHLLQRALDQLDAAIAADAEAIAVTRSRNEFAVLAARVAVTRSRDRQEQLHSTRELPEPRLRAGRRPMKHPDER